MKKILVLFIVVILFLAPLVSAFSFSDINSFFNNAFYNIFNIIGRAIQQIERWQDKAIIVNDLPVNNLRTIPAHSYLALDTIWAEYGSYIADETGSYRVYAALLDSQGDVIETMAGKLENSYEFKVN